MTTTPLSITVYGTLNGSGVGSLKVGPIGAREVWHPENVAVSGNVGSVVNDATCVVSVGDINTKALRDTSFFGSSGDATDKCSADVIKVGQYVWADWSGGDAGASIKLTVTGTREV